MEPDEFRRQVRDALQHLYDPAYLQVHPLLPHIASAATSDRLTRAQELRSWLKEGIEALHPQQGSPSGSPAWRSYLAVRCRYLQGLSIGEVASELGLSRRQAQRELRKGLDALAAALWQRLPSGGGEPPTVPGQSQELRQELDQWRLSRQAWEVRALLDDTLSMLRPLLEEHRPIVHVDLPCDLPLVLADSTLTRQALFQVLRLMVRGAPREPISLRAIPSDKRVDIVLRGPSAALRPSEEDWQTAQLLMHQQGGTLTEHPLSGGRTRVVLGLPHASQTRVLVIEDNPAIHQLFDRYLTPHHYEVLHAQNGEEALRLATESRPDLITLDVMMPRMDGWQVLRELTQGPATAHIPVVVCSVLKGPDLALALGARAYLKKPVDRLKLLSTLAQLQQAAGPAGAASPAGRSGD
jgi:CheY-like chemotaxis protein/uncharacterized protein YjiS (DUF1127 family)